ncbi:MAG: hypothetical protein AVDCRST_MAG38-1980 [uncultured Solirubrobacteraceae bacterium]|uniref:MYG1 protein n=1 Tax=uncultured Solirubrobacteraceae bacterium TaxID=1162706 RepID=A0A6J4RY86_9ACTN|nr:MAG: hypothetical protein AVDCRST_MAG38-1980 [uncultured Solirubrobacteraceae bacterium]
MRVGTHDGTFHADEAFAVAALRLAHGPVEIIRTRDRERLAACDVRVDVGLRDDPAAGDFDHHQKGGAGERPNGIRYASFGLVWRAIGKRVCGDAAAAARVDEVLVQGVDAHDTGQTLTRSLIDGIQPMTLSGVVAAMNPRWDEQLPAGGEDARFAAAVDLAAGVLEREVAGAAAQARATQLVSDAIARAADPRLIELDAALPWRDAVVGSAPAALFVIYPKSSGWGLQAVPREPGSFANRLDLPSAWAGRSGAELAEVTGVQDAVFCHTGRFIAVAESREGIAALARQALDA